MLPKPEYPSSAYGAQFSDVSVVAAYPNRLPYPPDVFRLLTELITTTPRTVLDAGCGTSDLARRLAPLVERVDALDISAPMIALGRTLPGGDHPHLHWLLGHMEDVSLAPPYALVTAGESLHWMEWEVVLPRFQQVLSPGGSVAIVERQPRPEPWDAALRELFAEFSTNRLFQPYDLVIELEQRRLFTKQGVAQAAPQAHRQSIAAHIESIHSMNGFSRDRMEPEQAAAFDAQMRSLVQPFADDEMLALEMAARITWGSPTA